MSTRKKVILLTVVALACAGTIALAVVSEVMRLNAFGGVLPYIYNLGFGAGERGLLAIAAVGLMVAMDYSALLKPRLHGGVIAVVAGLAVAAANFPFVTLASGELVITADAGGMAVYVLYCVAVGLFEETAFRGFLLPLLLEMFKARKQGRLLAVVLSSGVFALVHLFNLFQGASVGGTLMQVGYTFLVGCMCAVIVLATRSLLMPIVIHALFDVGGLLVSSGVARGSQWVTPSIIIMIVVSVAAAAYLIYRFATTVRKGDRLL